MHGVSIGAPVRAVEPRNRTEFAASACPSLPSLTKELGFSSRLFFQQARPRALLAHCAPHPLPPPAALADQKFVVLGAGSAGMGVVSMIAQASCPLSGPSTAATAAACCPAVWALWAASSSL